MLLNIDFLVGHDHVSADHNGAAVRDCHGIDSAAPDVYGRAASHDASDGNRRADSGADAFSNHGSSNADSCRAHDNHNDDDSHGNSRNNEQRLPEH